jgi:hypothetical protein
MGLGSAAVYSLADARGRAAAARRLVAERIDPIEDRKARLAAATLERAKAMSFREGARGYLDAHRGAWRNAKHCAQWEATLETYVYPVCGGLAVQEIDVALVMRVVEPIWCAKPETASRGELLQKRRQLMDAWAKFCASTPTEGRVLPLRARA